jgi:uncharacterized protein YjiS (DUF1127 family)
VPSSSSIRVCKSGGNVKLEQLAARRERRFVFAFCEEPQLREMSDRLLDPVGISDAERPV